MPTPTPAPEAIWSLPIGMAVSWLLVIAVGVIEAGLVVAWLRQRRSAAASTPRGAHTEALDASSEALGAPAEALDVSWLASLLNQFNQGALVVDLNDRPVAWNEMAEHEFALDDPTSALPLSLLLLISKVLIDETEETTEIPDDRGGRLRVTVAPLGGTDQIGAPMLGALVLIRRPGEETGRIQSYRHLIGAMAHELRTPLTAILGHVDILGSCDPERDEALWRRSREFIASEAKRLARLVEDLLTLSRLDLTPLQRRPLNLRAVAEEAISALFQAAEARGVCLALQSAPGLPRVPGDRDRLHQVFLNLLDNACKYTAAGGQVTVHLSAGDDGVWVEVRDNGAGIAPEDLDHVFEPLYRGQDVRDVPGTGLGLTIVRTILEQHGSTIHVESVLGQGTTFGFCLPYAK
jgi:signal transduction histidine kinase